MFWCYFYCLFFHYHFYYNYFNIICYSYINLRCVLTKHKFIQGEENKYDCGKTLALALWGRAQTLMALEDYSLALIDLQQALRESLPNVFKAEAYWKMGICYKALNDENKAVVSFNLAEKLLDDNKKKQDLEISRKKSFNCCKKDESKGEFID